MARNMQYLFINDIMEGIIYMIQISGKIITLTINIIDCSLRYNNVIYCLAAVAIKCGHRLPSKKAVNSTSS